MLHNDLIALGLFLSYFIITGLPALLIKMYLNAPFEVVRKMLHLIITMSIFPLLELFSTWYMAILGSVLLVLIAYPLLALVDHSALYKRLAVERECGEFKRSLIIVQLSIASLIFIFWGLLGEDWQYIAAVAVMAWGFGDAAAALVGKAFGRHRIRHEQIDGPKTVEGSHAMLIVSGLAAFLTLQLYAGHPWHISLPVAFIVAIVSSAVELFSRRGMDTLTVPISAGFTALTLLTFFSFLGI